MDGGRADWDENTTKIFLDICIAEKDKFNFNKKGLTKLGWQDVYRLFRQQTGRAYDRYHLCEGYMAPYRITRYHLKELMLKVQKI